jgi:hypothetical protein
VSEKKKEEKIAVEEIPANVMEVINRVVPGGTIKKAEKREKEGKITYKVKKVVEAGEYEIKVTADGVLEEVERED